MSRFIATLVARYEAPDEVEASLTADCLADEAQKLLDQDETAGEISVTSVSDVSSESKPDDVIVRLRQARNDLIRTRFKDAYDCARMLDEIAHALDKRLRPEEVIDYDHGDFLEIAIDVLRNGGNPI